MKFKMKKKNIILFVVLLVIQVIIQVVVGFNKEYIHMDEGYSLGLANYDKVEIQDNQDFYNTWHNGDYFEDYLAVQDKDIGNYAPVYENQKNDVHPPLYYLFLRFAMGFSINHFSMWPGIILNIIIYIFITIFMYLILKRLFKNDIVAMIVSVISSITMASLTNVIYIRMYSLSTFNIILTMYLHLRLYDANDKKRFILPLIGLSALAGSLTHYYYLFFLAPLYVMFMVKYIKEKNWKMAGLYTLTMLCAAITSLLIFPYSIKHLFFGYRGQGALSNLSDFSIFFSHIGGYLFKVYEFAFNHLLLILFAIILVLVIVKFIKKLKLIKNNYLKFLIIPTLVYFVIVAIASPWIELRYIMPICQFIFAIVFYFIYILLQGISSNKIATICISILLLGIILAPIPFNLEPEVAYTNKKEIVNTIKTENLPTIFLFNSNNNRFLDDIYLFSLLNESYIAKDLDCTENNIKNIFANKDISNGIFVFINEGQNNDELLAVLKNALNLNNIQYLKRLNACDVYRIN